MNKHFFYGFVLFAALVLSCCKPDKECNDPTNPECPNYVAPTTPVDPCAGATLTTADFITYQHTWYNVVTDTLIEFHQHCLWGRAITLQALQDSAEYHWVIGSDHYYTREVTFQFGAEFIGQNIPLTLTVTRTPNTQCFPNDTGTATKTKIVTPRSGCDASIYGKYYGAWGDNPADSFVFELAYTSVDQVSSCDGILWIIGAKPNHPDTCIAPNGNRLNNYIKFGDNAGICYAPEGKAFLDSTLNNIMIDYSILVNQQTSLPREHHVFKGYRIN